MPRALVNVNSRGVLTDYQGRFELAGFTDSQAFATVTKPGFSPSRDGAQGGRQQKIADLDAPVELRLYPDAVVTGSVTGGDGLPLSRVQVRLLRLSYDSGLPRWLPSGFATTDSHGEYRITTPGGRFRVSVSYVPEARETGQAIMPVSFPQESETNTSAALVLRSGEEQRVDLRPRTGPAFPVTVRVDPAEESRANVRFTILTSAGESFFAGYTTTSAPGEFRFLLPSGSYTLRGHVDTRDDALDGSAKLTVAGREVSGVALHLAPDALLPVELVPQPASTSQSTSATSSVQIQPPDARQFNLSLHNQAAKGDGGEQDIQLRPREDKTYVFRVPPGRYRLQALGGGQWHIEGATYGATDLLANEIVIGAGTGGAPIRLLVSNATGTIHGRVNLPDGLSSAWIYLIPVGPSLLPINPIALGGGVSPATVTATVPVGAYVAIAVDHRLQQDLRDPEFLSVFSKGPKSIEVQVNADTAFDLEFAALKGEER